MRVISEKVIWKDYLTAKNLYEFTIWRALKNVYAVQGGVKYETWENEKNIRATLLISGTTYTLNGNIYTIKRIIKYYIISYY